MAMAILDSTGETVLCAEKACKIKSHTPGEREGGRWEREGGEGGEVGG